jgi:general secretion pathway protein N
MRWVLGLLVVLGLAVWLMPLTLVVRQVAPGLEAEAISGSIWKGRLRNARYAGVPLGDLDVGLDPRRLLQGEVSLGFSRLGPQLDGRLGGSRDELTAEGLTGAVVLPLLPPPVPEVRVHLSEAHLRLDRAGRCRSAGGEVTALLQGVPLIGETPPLVGVPRCDGDALLAPLVAPGGDSGLDLRLWPDGRWQGGLWLKGLPPLAGVALQALGFGVDAQGALRLEREGRLAGAS